MLMRKSLPFFIIVILALQLVACGSSTSTTSTTSNGNPSPAVTSATQVTPTPSPTATSTPSNNTAVLILTATATVGGKSETILTNTQGMTLYYFVPDTATTIACLNKCAVAWPPLLAKASTLPTSTPVLPGMLTTITSANGLQVEYNGHPLYTFSGDTAPGQTNGQGLNGKWYVATPDLAAANASYSGY